MNKSDNSDRSRGQLTAGTDTCHLLQIQFPCTWIRETGQTHFFAAFRTYKKWIPVVLRVPSASTRIFLHVVDTDTYQQSASMCIYRATQDGSWGLTFVMYFNHGIQVLSRWRNSRIVYRSLVWLFQCTKYSGYSTLSNKNSLPMGVMMVPEVSLAFISIVFMKRHHRVRASAPDGSSPRGYSWKKIEYRLKYIVPTFNHQNVALLIISSGARSALPMVVAPEAIVKYFRV
jgi:hypothetical protein